jgi:hypothetical protein
VYGNGVVGWFIYRYFYVGGLGYSITCMLLMCVGHRMPEKWRDARNHEGGGWIVCTGQYW